MRDLHTDMPWASLRSDLKTLLDKTIIAHTPQLKLSGELHEQTGAGFIEGVGNVHRKTLTADFTQVEKIIDPTVQEAVKAHLEKFGNNPKLAFAEGVTVFQKNGTTPIKRVRIVQSKTTLKKLQESKFGVKDKQGKVFKWLAYGNLHHVEILKEVATQNYYGEFVTTMLAHRRVKGIGMPKQPMIKTEHGAGLEFVMVLHINEIVSVEKDGKRVFYRVQKLASGLNAVYLRLHSAAVLDRKEEEIYFPINAESFKKWQLQKHKVNVLGKLL
jgi:CRISPR-associated endonuclease Csn1